MTGSEKITSLIWIISCYPSTRLFFKESAIQSEILEWYLDNIIKILQWCECHKMLDGIDRPFFIM